MSRPFPMYYGLDEKPCDQAEAARLFSDKGNEDRVVASDYIGDIHVSTVFLVLDHGFGSSVPILYETMIFGGKHDGYQRRYATRKEAAIGHIDATWLVEGEFRQWVTKLARVPSTAMTSVKRLLALWKSKLGM